MRVLVRTPCKLTVDSGNHGLSGTSIHQPFDGIQVFLSQPGQVDALRHELAQETVRVLI